nr:hypothetical protein [Candidatus Woesearchaeota archaeon]
MNQSWLLWILLPLSPIGLNLIFWVLTGFTRFDLLLTSLETILFYNLTISSINIISLADTEQNNLKNKLSPQIWTLLLAAVMYLAFYFNKYVKDYTDIFSFSVPFIAIIFSIAAMTLSYKIVRLNQKLDYSKVMSNILQSDKKQQTKYQETKKMKAFTIKNKKIKI